MKEKIHVENLSCFTKKKTMNLVCDYCGTISQEVIDNDVFIEDSELECVFYEGFCEHCGKSFTNCFEFEDVCEEKRSERTSNTLRELCDSLKSCGVHVELHCVKTKIVKGE